MAETGKIGISCSRENQSVASQGAEPRVGMEGDWSGIETGADKAEMAAEGVAESQIDPAAVVRPPIKPPLHRGRCDRFLKWPLTCLPK